jgi:hypothetical protein
VNDVSPIAKVWSGLRPSDHAMYVPPAIPTAHPTNRAGAANHRKSKGGQYSRQGLQNPQSAEKLKIEGKLRWQVEDKNRAPSLTTSEAILATFPK